MEEELKEATQELAIQSKFLTQWVENFLDGALGKAVDIVIALVIFIVGKKLLNVLLKIVDRSMERLGTEITVRKFLKYLLRAAGYGVIVLAVLQTVGIETTSLLALFASAGVAIGLALQGSLANFAGGVLILLMRPFRVGDYIIEDGHGDEGTVKSIGLVYTELVTPDNKLIVIPNGNLSNNSLTNVTAQEKRRVDIPVGISYSADLKKAKSVLLQVMKKQSKILKDEEMMVIVSSLDDSCVKMECRCWASMGDYWDVKWDLTEQVKLALDEAEIEIPFPQIVVHQG